MSLASGFDPRHSLPAATPPLNKASLHKDLKLPVLYAGEKRYVSFGRVCNCFLASIEWQSDRPAESGRLLFMSHPLQVAVD